MDRRCVPILAALLLVTVGAQSGDHMADGREMYENDTIFPRTFGGKHKQVAHNGSQNGEDFDINSVLLDQQSQEKARLEGSEWLEVSQEVEEQLTGSITTVLLPVIYILVFVVGLPSNGLALWVLCFRVKPKKPSTIYMINLAVADLLFILLLPLKITYHLRGNDWPFGKIACHVFLTSFYGNMYCSILLLTCISVDRGLAIIYPMRSLQWRRNRYAMGICVGTWVVVLLSTVPLQLVNPLAYIDNLHITTCYDVFPIDTLPGFLFYYYTALCVLCFLVPFLVTVACYALIIRSLARTLRNGDGNKRTRSIQLAALVLLTFVLCFAPSNIVLLLHFALLRYKGASDLYIVYMLCLSFSSLNSCLDPFVYYFMSTECRRKLSWKVRGLAKGVSKTSRRYFSSFSTHTTSGSTYSNGSSKSSRQLLPSG
ncbi:proteinase-activated receptor 2-like [Lampetra fluviatilis]